MAPGDEEWDRILNVNLRSVRLTCQVFGQAMIVDGGFSAMTI